jgi:hypothetical protein
MKKWLSNLTPGQKAVIAAACITAIAAIIAAYLQGLGALEREISVTQTAEARLTLLAQQEGPTITPTMTPSLTSTSTSTSTVSPTFTNTPNPTPTPTIENFDVFDDFNNDSLDSSIWERSEGDATPNFNNSILSINRDSEGGYVNWMLFGRQNGKSLDTFATEVKIVDGSHWGSAGITASIISIDNESWYVDFGISNTGDVFLMRGVSGTGIVETLGEWHLGDINIPHRLRIEWTDQEVHFFDDGKLLMLIPSNKPGYWAVLYANANEGGSIHAEFNWAGWNYK